MTLKDPPNPGSMTTSGGGISTAAYSWFQNLKASTASLIASAMSAASVSDFLGNATSLLLALTPKIVWDSVADVALTDAASITVDMSGGANFTVTILGNRTIANPTNAIPGKAGRFKVTASGATRTIDVGTNYKKTSDITFPVSIASGQIAYIYYHVDTSSRILITSVLNNPT